MSKRQGESINDDELARIIQSELSQAAGYQDDALSQAQRTAIAYYYGVERQGDAMLAEDGRSTLQTTDFADMVEAIVAQLQPGLAREDVAQFEPRGEDDEDQAELETGICADQIWQENDGYLELQQAVKDACMCRTAWFKVWVDVDETSSTEKVSAQPEEVLLAAYASLEPNERLELKNQEKVGQTPEGDDLYDVTLVRISTHRKLRCEAVNTLDMSWAGDWTKSTIEGCRFVAQREELERAQLLDEGVPMSVVRELGAYTVASSQNAQVRATTHTTQAGGYEWSTELVECQRCHLRIDLNSNGAPSLYEVLYADDRVLTKKEVGFLPYVNGYVMQRPYRIEGLSLLDKLKQVEDAKTHALREWSDNLVNQNTNSAGLVDGQVRISEWITRQPRGYVTIKSPDAIVPIVSQDIGPSAQLYLDYQDKMRSERGGASLDLQSAEAQVAGHTAHGTERQYTARELLAALMARNVAETLLRGLMRLIHRTLRTSNMGEIEKKRAGEWQRSDPREWKERTRLKVNTGLTPAEVERVKGALREAIALNVQAMQQGMEGVLATPATVHAAAIDFFRAAGLPAPEQYAVDPASPAARQAMKLRQQQQQAQEQELQQTRAALLDLTLRHERYQHDTDLQLKQWQTQVENRFKYFDSMLDAQVKEAEMVADAATSLANASQQGNGADTGG